MKKIIIPFEGPSYRPELLEFVKALNDKSKVFLTAAFVPEVDYAQLWVPGSLMEGNVYIQPAEDEDKIVARNSARVRRFCDDHGVGLRIHEDRFDFALAAIRKETRFADLLLLSNKHFFEIISPSQPNAYMTEMLHDTECPILLQPDEPRMPGEIVLAYDGSRASVYAIRQFAYLFPEFSRVQTTLIYVDAKGKGEIPEQGLVRELGALHFRNFRLLRLSMHTDTFYDTWIGMMKDPWLVAGAYGRSDWSRLFSHSFINRMLNEHNVPLFLAHP
ncbi:hypothetical protein [Puia dinghuensis]|uniref:Universal stress protein n=1 Tax=Puia dinghuensis TaxID=1792502 RepID=A0A8J2XSZ0_9BACT|nr:hypothetical protein [Puia dinghuensis]GGA94681.1 hypothetical protein GCM10011511_17470 [Puia dinghuensis]